jgi:ATP-dependent Lhr-like helicase
VLDALGQRGALFVTELSSATRRLPTEIENALWDAVARGLVTADGFGAVRALLAGRQQPVRRHQARRGLRRGASGRTAGEGRWSLLPPAEAIDDRDALAEAVAEQLLARWGVVFRDLLARETLAVPWRDVLWAFRRMEARGTIRGGRFVTGFSGEQYALPEAVEQLRAVRRRERTGETVRISATDPLNLVGIITPGPRVTAVRTNTVAYVDGLPVSPEESRALVSASSTSSAIDHSSESVLF